MDSAATTVEESSKDFSRLAINDIHFDLIRPAIAAGAIQIKPGTILMMQSTIQFGGSTLEDPKLHIKKFGEFCDTLELNGDSKDTVKLRLFLFSLRDKAKFWFHSLPVDSLTKWEEIEHQFLVRFCPLIQATAVRNTSTQFSQLLGEFLCTA